jgi:uncharacterized protein YjbI with pentapeptide repeats
MMFFDEERRLMSEQNETNVSTKPRRSHQASTQKTTLRRPTNDDKEAWKAYWKAQGQSWRTEPEIDAERQLYLAERRSITPNIEQGIYSFMDIDPKLSRADVEWLLVTHENGCGPVNWNDESQREREGLDLRGADLRDVDLHALPLVRIIAGPRFNQLSDERYEAATIRLERANLGQAHLEGADLVAAHLEGADLFGAYLGETVLSYADLEGADLSTAYLEGADLSKVYLGGADLVAAHLEGAFLFGAYLKGASLDGVFFDRSTILEAIELSNNGNDTASLSDILWGDVNVALVDWSTISTLGDENEAKDNKSAYGYEKAARAYRQLSVVLRNQGINEHAARFTYRAQLMQRKVFWYKRKFLSYLGSLFLDLLSGYGYKPVRCFIAYLLVILTFATAYFIIGNKIGPVLSPLGSFVFSMTSFHGRGFFPGGIGLDDPLTVVAALEAFIGLLIEVTFIATLTQRLFGK